MKRLLILGTLLCASFAASAKVNFVVGKTFGSDSDLAPTKTFTAGVEFDNGKYLVGSTFTRGGESGYKEFVSPQNFYLGSWSAETDHFLVNLYGGKYVTDNLALKAGVGLQRSSWAAKTHETKGFTKGVNPSPIIDVNTYGDSGNTYYAMVGAGYHYKNINFNIHYNHALNSGISGVDASTFNNVTALVGVRW